MTKEKYEQKKKEIRNKKILRYISNTNTILWLFILLTIILNKNIHKALNLNTQSILIGIGLGAFTIYILKRIPTIQKQTRITQRDKKTLEYLKKWKNTKQNQ